MLNPKIVEILPSDNEVLVLNRRLCKGRLEHIRSYMEDHGYYVWRVISSKFKQRMSGLRCKDCGRKYYIRDRWGDYTVVCWDEFTDENHAVYEVLNGSIYNYGFVGLNPTNATIITKHQHFKHDKVKIKSAPNKYIHLVNGLLKCKQYKGSLDDIILTIDTEMS